MLISRIYWYHIDRVILFIITFYFPRIDIEPEWVANLDYLHKYFEYLKYVGCGFIHFAFMYVFGMYLSAHKEKIDIFYEKRRLLFVLMLLTTIGDIYFMHNGMFYNSTLSKIFLTVLVLGYLKHYDEWIKSHEKLNKILDVTAKYSFGLFFVHWYFVFAFNQLFNVPKVVPVVDLTSLFFAIGIACFRYVFVLGMSFISLFLIKKLIKKFKIDNTRQFIGV